MVPGWKEKLIFIGSQTFIQALEVSSPSRNEVIQAISLGDSDRSLHIGGVLKRADWAQMLLRVRMLRTLGACRRRLQSRCSPN